jgi:probable lipoprotein NlpC
MITTVESIKNTLYGALLFIFITLFITACTSIPHRKNSIKTISRSAPTAQRSNLSKAERQKIARIATQCLGKSQLNVGKTPFRADCSGTIRAIFAKAKVGLGGIIKNHQENDVKAIYRYTQKYGKILKSDPEVGDLVFFHNTYDRSRNGHMNDALTHIGIVEKIDGSTVHFIHHFGQAIIRSRMDLKRPKTSFDPNTKKRINHVLRRAQGSHRAYTAAELFAGFGRL